jgi:hypothetical protein
VRRKGLDPEKSKAELQALKEMPDEEIDYSDIPPLDAEMVKKAQRGAFYRQQKKKSNNQRS